MARFKCAKWLGEHSPKRKMARYDIVCIHTIVGHDPAHAAHFSTGGDGTLTQSRDTEYQSAANLEGNPRVLAIENEDTGAPFPKWTGSDVPPLTEAQLDRCAEVLAEAHEVHGVPLQLCPDSRPGSRGLAYHRQGIDGNFGVPGAKFPGRVPGGEVWTEHRGKVCPGDRRIAQLPEILRRAKIIAGQPEEEDMPLSDDDIEKIANKVVSKMLDASIGGLDDGTKKARPLKGLLAVINNRVDEIRDKPGGFGS